MTTVVNRRLTFAWDIYIGRGSIWGNPFSHVSSRFKTVKVATREEAILQYEEWIKTHPELIAQAKRELRGKVLACYCKPLACHGDVLARIADEE